MEKMSPSTSRVENDKLSLPTEEQLDALEWARDFMKRYEKKKISPRYFLTALHAPRTTPRPPLPDYR